MPTAISSSNHCRKSANRRAEAGPPAPSATKYTAWCIFVIALFYCGMRHVIWHTPSFLHKNRVRSVPSAAAIVKPGSEFFSRFFAKIILTLLSRIRTDAFQAGLICRSCFVQASRGSPTKHPRRANQSIRSSTLQTPSPCPLPQAGEGNFHSGLNSYMTDVTHLSTQDSM